MTPSRLPLVFVSVCVCLCACLTVSVSLRVSKRTPISCSLQGLNCDVDPSNCLDHGWLEDHSYTPSAPEQLQVSWDTRIDEAGQLQPMLLAKWKLKDDGSIRFLNATELQVLVSATNENLCIRYILRKTLEDGRTPTREQWSFVADMLVLDPGQTYRVSVFNIPKPKLDYSHYDVSKEITVPGCEDPRMKMTHFCIEEGSMWEPNINISANKQGSALTVSFSTDVLCEEYIVIARCSTIRRSAKAYRMNQKSLDVTFNLNEWPKSCCQFVAEIKPLFPSCDQDCVRSKRTQDICPAPPKLMPPDASAAPPYTFVSLGVVVMCVVAIAVAVVLCKKTGRSDDPPAPPVVKNIQQRKQAPKVLIIYSQDHHLYRDIVLKLCAFLRAKCGTEVLLDLTDSTSVGMVGRVRWLEWQRQQLKNPSDKILVLCSKGVQAKWRAMCGQDRVQLREDVLSPTDDMLTPFLNLFLPDMHQARMHGKYMVAYFDDISSEEDVPSVFDIGVKYKLMKHFEELYFRILDEEKYQPDHVKHIEGISGDDYFNCDSGRGLKNAIEIFQAYQLENPDWFERECMDAEEEVMSESKHLLDQMKIPPVLECVPLIRAGTPIHIHDIQINEGGHSVHVRTPELNTQHQISSVVELTPLVNPEVNHYPSGLVEVSTDRPYPHSFIQDSVYSAEPVFNMPPPLRQNWSLLQVEPSGQTPTEDDEEDSFLPISQISSQPHPTSLALVDSLDPPESSQSSMQSEYLPGSAISQCQPVEVDVLESGGKGQISGSDQGYISKISSQHESPFKDPLAALRELQEALLQDNLRFFDEQAEGN